MNGIDANKHAWAQLSHDHYLAYKKLLLEGRYQLNPYIERELGGLSDKKILHLQCNVGADTILLAKMGAGAVGVDLVPDNIHYAKKLAQDLGVSNIDFIESDVLQLMEKHDEKYDVIFVSEGAICWLPELKKWGRTIRHFLKDDGFFYIFDNHPFFMMLDERRLADNIMEVKYPYFGTQPDIDESIGGYTSEPKRGVQAYSWVHTAAEIINSLTAAGLHIEYFHEFQENFFDAGGMNDLGRGLWNYGFNDGLFPISFSLKATVCKR